MKMMSYMHLVSTLFLLTINGIQGSQGVPPTQTDYSNEQPQVDITLKLFGIFILF